MYLNCEAVVLRKYRYSETSYILHLFTKEYGRVNALAKGARRNSSPMNGHFDLYNLEEVTLFRNKRSDLDLATGANLLVEYVELRRSPLFYSCAAVISEIVLKSCMLYDKHALAFEGLISLLSKSSELKAKPVSILVKTLWLVLRDLGLEPQLSTCLVCGESEIDSFVLSPKHGGSVCKKCNIEGGRTILRAGDLAGLRYMAGSISNYAVSFTNFAVVKALEDYVCYVLSTSISSFGIFRSLIKNYSVKA